MANPCTWTYSGDDWGTFDTTCGQAFSLTDGTPKENTYNYCPSCGGPLVEVYPPDPVYDDEDDDSTESEPDVET